MMQIAEAMGGKTSPKCPSLFIMHHELIKLIDSQGNTPVIALHPTWIDVDPMDVQ